MHSVPGISVKGVFVASVALLLGDAAAVPRYEVLWTRNSAIAPPRQSR